jgi:hypothetical protein
MHARAVRVSPLALVPLAATASPSLAERAFADPELLLLYLSLTVFRCTSPSGSVRCFAAHHSRVRFLTTSRATLSPWPSYIQAISHKDLEVFDGVSEGRYTIGLGNEFMSFTDDREVSCLRTVGRSFLPPSKGERGRGYAGGIGVVARRGPASCLCLHTLA